MKNKVCLVSILITLLFLILGCSLLPQPPNIKFKFNPSTADVSLGGTCIIEVEITSDKNSSNLNIEYVSTDTNIVTLEYSDESIMLYGKNIGTAKIIAKANDIEQSSFIVKCIDPTEIIDPENSKYITTSQTTISARMGVEKTLYAALVNGSPAEQNGIIWTTPNSDIIELVGSGASVIITAKAEGTAQILISHPNSVNSVIIYIKIDGSTQTITLSSTGLSMDAGDEKVITADLSNDSPQDYNDITWEIIPSDAECISILGSGGSITVFANSSGSAVIRARTSYGTFTDCEVLVRSIKVLSASPNYLDILVGEEESISVFKSPANLQIEIKSTNSSIITYVYDPENSEIIVRGTKDGNCTLVIGAGGLSTTVDIHVEQPKLLEFSSQSIRITPSQTGSFTYTLLPSDDEIKWTISDPTVANYSVDIKNTRVTVNPIKEGNITITGITSSGIKTSMVCEIWYDNITVDYSSSIIASEADPAKKHTTFDASGNQIMVGDRCRLQINVGFPQKGINIKSIKWTSSGFHDKMSLNTFDGGRKITLYFEPDWTGLDWTVDSGSLTVEIQYGNGKTYSKVFNLKGWCQAF